MLNTFDEGAALAFISDRLTDPRIEAYFTQNRHKQSATRGLLELFGVPLPEWATRKLNGQAAVAKAALDRFRADHPHDTTKRG